MGYVDEGSRGAEALRRELGLGIEAVPDIFHLMEDLGVAVFRQPLGQDAADGLLLVSDDVTAVLINSDCVVPRQRFTAAHELGHWRLDAGSRIWVDEDVIAQQRSVVEKRANAFAANFLMPAEGVRRVVERAGPKPVTPGTLVHVQRHFGVSFQSALWHLHNIGLVSKRDVERMQSVAPETLALSLGYDEQVLQEREERGRRSYPREYLRRAIGAYATGTISAERLGELLSLPADAVESRLRSKGIEPPPPGMDV